MQQEPGAALRGATAELLRALTEQQARHEERIEQLLEEQTRRVNATLSGLSVPVAAPADPRRCATPNAWAPPVDPGSPAGRRLPGLSLGSLSPSSGQAPPLPNSVEDSATAPLQAIKPPSKNMPRTNHRAASIGKSEVVLFDSDGDESKKSRKAARAASSSSTGYGAKGRFFSTLSRYQAREDVDSRQNIARKTVTERMKEIQDAEKVAYQYQGPAKTATKYIASRPSSGLEGIQLKVHNACVELLNCRIFELSVSLIIVANAVTMGAQVEIELRTASTKYSGLFVTLEYFYMAAFMLELLVRINAEGRTFLSPSNRAARWNLFDTVIVGMSLCDMVYIGASASQNKTAAAVSAVRLFRLLRLVRILRIIRVLRFFRELRVMVSGIMSSMKPLMFAVLLLLMIMYIFAMFILQMVATEQRDQVSGTGMLTSSEYQDLIQHFDTLPRTLMTLYQSILGGVDWGQVVEPLLVLHSMAGVLFYVYIAFGMLCVLNIVTGVFVETANKITAQDEEAYLLQELANRREWLDDVVHHFRSQDQDGSGEVDWHEFKENAAKVEVQAWFRKVGIDLESECTEGLFKTLDFDGDGLVDIDEFVDSLQQVRGPARAIDMARLKYEVRMLNKRLIRIDNTCGGSTSLAPSRIRSHSSLSTSFGA